MKLFGIVPVTVVVFVALATLMYLVLHHTRFGYRVQTVGRNPEAAAQAGIPTSLVRLQTLVLMGAICGLSDVMYVGVRSAIDPRRGQRLHPGRRRGGDHRWHAFVRGHGTIIGAVVGMMIIQVISSGLIFFGIDATWSSFVTGAVTVLAVSLDRLIKFQRARQAERRRDKPD